MTIIWAHTLACLYCTTIIEEVKNMLQNIYVKSNQELQEK